MVKNDVRLNRLTPFAFAKTSCAKQHKGRDVNCVSGIVYKIPFDCGLCYIEKTKHWLNDCLTEHKCCVKNRDPYSKMSKHVIECNNCIPLWQSTFVILTERNYHKRLVKEPFTVINHGNTVNTSSLSLDTELGGFLQI